jgi:XTP/dITP diphosphohydrolase
MHSSAACSPKGASSSKALSNIKIATSEPVETGSTFEANATIKATSYALQTGMMCLADDSGLEIDALGGKPGVISSHYCTSGRETGMSRPERDAANNQRVLTELASVPFEKRTARFVCVMCLAAPAGADSTSNSRDAAFQAPSSLKSLPLAPAWLQQPVLVRGTFEGRIGIPPAIPRGANGFGYDPLFLVGPDFAVSSAELSPEHKNKLSHRGAAAVQMAEHLKKLL